ncbi:hypothetical protein [Collimonas arenae]|nr:hypothetical protein [Collimonas arenae]
MKRRSIGTSSFSTILAPLSLIPMAMLCSSAWPHRLPSTLQRSTIQT